MKELNQFELENVAGGAIPVAVWALWTAAGAAGLGAGVQVGLNRVNREKK